MLALIAQFAAQLMGYVLAGAAAPLAGPWALLAMQTVALLIGFLLTLALPDFPPVPAQDEGSSGWQAGFSIV